MNRLNANLEILDLLKKFLVDNPDQRFHQALYNLDLLKDDVGVDSIRTCRSSYNWESESVLKLMKAALAKHA